MDANKRKRPCPICGCDGVRHVFDNAMAALDGIDMSYRVGDCPECGFSYAYELPDEQAYQDYYQRLSKYDVAAALAHSDHLRFEAIVRMVKARLGEDPLLVDIGCGEGALLSKLRDAGIKRLYGLDPAPQAPAVARTKYEIETVRSGFFNDAATIVPLSSADGVCIAAVLEHLPNLRTDMQSLLGELRQDCVVFIEVPCLELFAQGQGEPFGEFSLEHINFFCMESLSAFMASMGWNCLQAAHLSFPEWQTGSVVAAFTPGDGRDALRRDPPRLDAYVAAGQVQVKAILDRLPRGDVIIWGAGSHSARLLPLLQGHAGLRVRALVDANPNLQGKRLGGFTVQSPSILATMPELPVVVSSFRSQHDIAARLRREFPNPLALLYP